MNSAEIGLIVSLTPCSPPTIPKKCALHLWDLEQLLNKSIITKASMPHVCSLSFLPESKNK